ncbi:transporter [Klebsiella michiganensis]|nr:transporter [Klebsiella michiganensis]
MPCSLRPTALRCWWGVFSSASGESFTAIGATLWGIKTVGAIHTSRVISWNGMATYVAMAVGAPLGVMLNGYFGISGFAAVGDPGGGGGRAGIYLDFAHLPATTRCFTANLRKHRRTITGANMG